MSKTILADVDGFTPVIDSVVEETTLISAVVFGRTWRFCQMSDGVCKASLDTISSGIGLDRATVLRHLKVLCDAGFLVDTTPDARNVPHIYGDTGKAGLRMAVQTVAHSNRSVADSNKTVAQSHLKIVSKRDSKDSKNTRSGKHAPQSGGEFNYTWRENVREMGKEFVLLFRPPLDKGEYILWMQGKGATWGFEQFRTSGVTVDELVQAFHQMQRAKLTIKGPGSLRTYALEIHMKNKRNGGSDDAKALANKKAERRAEVENMKTLEV